MSASARHPVPLITRCPDSAQLASPQCAVLPGTRSAPPAEAGVSASRHERDHSFERAHDEGARSTCGCTLPRPARLAFERTHRCAVRRSRRWPSWRRRIGPAVRSPRARSIVRAVTGARGMTAGLFPFPTMRSVRWRPLEPDVLDVGRARLAHSQSVEAEEDRQGGVGRVEPLGAEEKGAEPRCGRGPGRRWGGPWVVGRTEPGWPGCGRRCGGTARSRRRSRGAGRSWPGPVPAPPSSGRTARSGDAWP